MSNLMKRFLRNALIVVGVLFLYVAWVYFQPDDDLSPELQVALAQRPKSLPDDQTAAVALLGLEAPAGEDFKAYGRKVLAAQRAGMDWMAAAKLASNGKPALTINFPADLECWMYSKGEAMDDYVRNNCASEKQVVAHLESDAEMIARYRGAQKLSRPSGDIEFKGQPAINLSKLNAVEVAYDARRGKPEEAYGKWRDHYIHQTQMAGNGSPWVLTAINLVDEGLSLSALDILLEQAPQLMDAHRAELLEFLQPGDLSRNDIPAIYLGENVAMGRYFSIPSHARWLRVNRLRNQHFENAKEILQLARKPTPELLAGLNAFKGSDSGIKVLRFADLLDPTDAIARNEIRDNEWRCIELINSMVAKEAHRRLFTLKLNLAAAMITDSEIPAYLQKTPTMLRNPWDAMPAIWDPKRRVIAMKRPSSNAFREVHL